MRIFWTMFFLGSMLLVGLDTMERRESPRLTSTPMIAGDSAPIPTPRED